MYKILALNNISQKGIGLLTDSYELTENPGEATAVIVRSADMHGMDFPENLLAIARAGAGVNNIPVDKCTEQGIVVFNTPGANANAVNELVFAGMIMAARNIPAAIEWEKALAEDIEQHVEKGKAQFTGSEIRGKTLGIVGLGNIGVLVAGVAEAFGMRVIGYDPYLSPEVISNVPHDVVFYNDLKEMLPECDYVTIHIPSNGETNGMVDHDMISCMKKGSVLANFSRGALVVNKDLNRALEEKRIRAYVTDFPSEEIQWSENVILFPHLGASTEESEENCATMAVGQLMDYLENGNITNSVNFPTIDAGRLEAGTRIVSLHENIPAMIFSQTGELASMGLNISDLVNKSKGKYACTLIDIEGDIDEEVILKAFEIDGIISVRIIKPR
ncbi:MAG: 3-phosphoglycerate dehydrogenase family protein [Clostridiales bacterium]|nr:3-phosphoglycerate dehydrogenase family protein [Clostridiales bacterium]